MPVAPSTSLATGNEEDAESMPVLTVDDVEQHITAHLPADEISTAATACHTVILEGIEVSDFLQIEDSVAGLMYNIRVERADGDKEMQDGQAANKSFVALQSCGNLYDDESTGLVNSLESNTAETGPNIADDPNIDGVSHDSHDATGGDSESDGINSEATAYVADSERKRMKKMWKREEAKMKRNSGNEYVSRSGKIVPKKLFKDVDCHCPLSCSAKLSTDEKNNMFTLYWKSSREAKLAFVCGHVRQSSVKRRCSDKEDSSRRHKTRLFYFTKADNSSVRVCKQMFCKTIQISNGCLDRTLKRESDGSVDDDKLEVSGSFSPVLSSKPPVGGFEERRGKKEPANKTVREYVEAVIKHINSFPQYISHYCRKDSPGVKYLPQYLNLALMYRMYKEDHGEKAVSESIYRKIFKTEFNLKFQLPKKDTCTKCDAYQTQLNGLQSQPQKGAEAAQTQAQIESLECQRNTHQEYAQMARNSLKFDRMLAKQNDLNKFVITFDLQSTLPTPRLSSNIVYYKRQLMVYNLGIHDCNTEIGHMHVWHEGVASRGSQEISSCITTFLKAVGSSECPETELVMWSDSCGGQNRNIKMSLSLLKLVCSDVPFTTITQKFLESGHSFLPNDSDFGDIEKRLKYHPEVYVPKHWYDIIAEARSGSKPFVVHQMKQEDFLSTTTLETAITNRKTTVDSQKVNWFQIRQIEVRRTDPMSLFYKTSHNPEEPWKEIDLTRRGHSTTLSGITQKRLYEGPRAVNPLKKKDLISILHLVPSVYHEFYNNLTTGKTARSDSIEGLEKLDFELEDA